MSHRVPVTALVLVLAALLACSCSDDTTDPAGGGGNTETGDYLKGLPTWDEFCPPQATEDVATDTSAVCIDQAGDCRYLCVETPKSLTETPEDVVTFGGGADILWPGALIQGSTYVGGIGTMQELAIRQRSPLTISIDLLREDNTRTVADPTLATVGSAVGELIDAAHNAGHRAGSDYYLTRTEAYTMDQLALGLNLSARYLGVSVRNQLSYDTSTETRTVAAYFKQRMFAVNMVQPQTPEAVFSDAFTRERLQEQIDLGRVGPGNLPVYVSQVIYGRLLVVTMTSTRSATEMKNALQASYAAVEAGVTMDDTSIFAESTLTVAAIGGNTSGLSALVAEGRLAEYFSGETALTEAKPIAYVLRNLADNTIASVAETTEYVERTCSAVEVTLHNLESSWRNTVMGEEGDEVFTFVPTAGNLALSNELASSPSANGGLGSVLTFPGAATGYPFDFVLRTPTAGAFVYNDQEGGNAYSGCTYPHVAPGDADNWEDDDFEIFVTRIDDGLAVSGIGVFVGHNGTTPEEFLEVYSPRGVLLEQFTQGLPSSTGYTFMGVASPLPLKRIFFNEDAGRDDMCFQNVVFAVRYGDGGFPER